LSQDVYSLTDLPGRGVSGVRDGLTVGVLSPFVGGDSYGAIIAGIARTPSDCEGKSWSPGAF
jgi:hypothetical protein